MLKLVIIKIVLFKECVNSKHSFKSSFLFSESLVVIYMFLLVPVIGL